MRVAALSLPPMLTMTASISSSPSPLIVSFCVASATTACVQYGWTRCVASSSRSTATTSCPSSNSVFVTLNPKLPSPIVAYFLLMALSLSFRPLANYPIMTFSSAYRYGATTRLLVTTYATVRSPTLPRSMITMMTIFPMTVSDGGDSHRQPDRAERGNRLEQIREKISPAAGRAA